MNAPRKQAQSKPAQAPPAQPRELERVENPFAGAAVVAQPTGASAQALVAREAQDILVQMLAARQSPRDPVKASDRVLNAFTRPGLCEEAMYSYARGGTEIMGLSIRAAEELARQWGNMRCGVAELSRSAGYSEVLAYAQDLETGYSDEKRFHVRHWRNVRGGKGYPVTDERDIYEVVSNQAARRKRACILAVVPGDIQEAAERQIAVTLKLKAEVTPERFQALQEKFAQIGVSKAQLEKKIQRHLEAMLPAQFLALGRMFNSIRDGMSTASEWFEPIEGEAPPPAYAQRTGTENVKEALREQSPGKAPAAVPPAAATADGEIPHYDTPGAIAALRGCKSTAELKQVWGEVREDFRTRGLPIDVEAAHSEMGESIGEREAMQGEGQ
ncbi:MAG: hypothetical protein ACRETH_05475 [Steroidobacteraceae bacterium]